MPNNVKNGKTKMARGGAMMMDEQRMAMARGGKAKKVTMARGGKAKKVAMARGGMAKKSNCGASVPAARGKK